MTFIVKCVEYDLFGVKLVTSGIEKSRGVCKGIVSFRERTVISRNYSYFVSIYQL